MLFLQFRILFNCLFVHNLVGVSLKLVSLFSGGKDSTYATLLAKKAGHSISCLLSIKSAAPESFMYHKQNIHLTRLSAASMDLPLIIVETSLGKEAELAPLEEELAILKKKLKIDGVVTGAVASTYQASRIQRICNDLDLHCFNPLWQKDQLELLNELLENKFEIIIVAVAAAGLDEKWLGRKLDKKVIAELVALNKKYDINIAGEGGELETFVLDCSLFRKKIKILEAEKKFPGSSGELIIKKAELAAKKK